jgi:DNA invertase Pin-like site-specific DNA recombinase
LSGAKAARPGLNLALEVARAGDGLTVWRLNRPGRSRHDLILLGRKLDKMGIGLMSVQEKIDTHTQFQRRKLVFQNVPLAEFERNLVRERTQAGLNTARARGRKGGRPKVLSMPRSSTRSARSVG